MKSALALGAAAMLGACAANSASAPAGAECDAAKAQSLVGRSADEKLQAEAQRLAGASTVRILSPGQIVTMEFLAGRLNIVVDAQNRVEAIRCG